MEQLSKRKVLITGITGFTGYHLEQEMLLQGYEVFGTSFDKSSCERHFQCNILNKQEVNKVLGVVRPNYIIHLAAISFVATENINSIYETNILGTLHILEALEELDLEVSKVLLASSAAVYGNVEGELSEELCPKPMNHYGNSKLAMENMASNYFSKFDIILARPFNYTGIGQNGNFLIPKIVNHFRNKESVIELGNLHTYREYNSVKNFVDIYIRLVESSFCSGFVNICSGKTYAIEQILQIMKEITGHIIRVDVNPKFIRKNEIIELKGSTKKLSEILPGSIESVDLRKTLASMFSN